MQAVHMQNVSTATPPAAERAYCFVKANIIEGTFDDSEMLSEAALASQLGMSRTPMREAFLRLEVEGFIKLYPKRGALVVPISPREIREVFEARMLVDEHSATHICNLSGSERDAIADVLDAIIAEQTAALDAEDLGTYAELDAKFHQTIMDNGGNSLLANLGHTLRERQQRFTAKAVGRNLERARAYVAQHKTLSAALQAGDLTSYLSILDDHLNSSRKQL
ncbi:putative transcriptional regulator, GntR family protein [Corynebacterium flavescens]|uniref:Transcriptional regulator, GntR family protein n=2 Tax=Corynebacterium flavescens TaxID=28028 RepID=A0AB73BAR4_CORFL|nr:GntR family transcriptional regulator [Corynebacterium flavescens]GEB98824.1 putative transcriptional regulator, GntR family protein [Corynebacterium flavescens]